MKTKVAHRGSKIVVMDGYGLPDDFEFELDQDGQPTVTMSLAATENGVECKSLTLRSTESCPNVLALHVRRLAFSDIRDLAIQRAAKPMRAKDGRLVMVLIEPTFGGPRAAVHAFNKRRLRMTPERLRRVAEIVSEYGRPDTLRADALASDVAYEAIADEFGLSYRSAQRWVQRANEKGLLKSSTERVSDGER